VDRGGSDGGGDGEVADILGALAGIGIDENGVASDIAKVDAFEIVDGEHGGSDGIGEVLGQVVGGTGANMEAITGGGDELGDGELGGQWFQLGGTIIEGTSFKLNAGVNRGRLGDCLCLPVGPLATPLVVLGV